MKDFDKVYKFYDRFMSFFNLYKFEDIENALELTGKEIILDIGGGTGQLANYLHNKCQTIYIIDESSKMLSKVPYKTNIKTIVGDVLTEEIKDNSVDIVIMSDVYHHILNQNKLLEKTSRILKNKGKVLILDFDKESLKTKFLILFEYMLFGKLYFKTVNEMKSDVSKRYKITKYISKGYYFILVGEKK